MDAQIIPSNHQPIVCKLSSVDKVERCKAKPNTYRYSATTTTPRTIFSLLQLARSSFYKEHEQFKSASACPSLSLSHTPSNTSQFKFVRPLHVASTKYRTVFSLSVPWRCRRVGQISSSFALFLEHPIKFRQSGIADGDSWGTRRTKAKENYYRRKDKAQGLCPAAASLHLLSWLLLSVPKMGFSPSASTCFSFLNTGTGLRAALSLKTARLFT